MSYNLGTASGRIEIDGAGGVKGFQVVEAAGVAMFAAVQAKANQIEDLGQRLIGIGASGVAGFGLATRSAAGFEQQISAIEAVSGAGGTQLDAMRKKALQLGADTVFSASEAANAIEELVKAGISVEDVLGGAADAAVALAAAGGIPIAEAANLAANAMSQFNLKASDLPDVVDAIAGAANASAIDIGQFAQSLQQVGAVANLAGLDVFETSVAIAELGNAGIRGSDAGTSLKTFLMNLIPVTDKQKDKFKELGITVLDTDKTMQNFIDKGIIPAAVAMEDLIPAARNYIEAQGGAAVGTAENTDAAADLVDGLAVMKNNFFDANGELKDFAEVQQVLQDATKNLTKEQKLAALEILFGSDAIRAAAILADEGAAGYNKLAEAINKTSAADVAAARMDNLLGSVEQLKGSFETAAIIIGTVFLPIARKIVDAITSVVNIFNNLPEPVQKAVGFLVALASIVSIATGALLLLVLALPALISKFVLLQIIKSVSSALRIFIVQMYGGAGASAAFTASQVPLQKATGRTKLLFQALTKAALLLKAAFLFATRNPLLIVLTLIVAALIWAYTNFEGFRNLVNRVAKEVGQFAMRMWEVVKKAFGEGVEAVVKFAQNLWDDITRIFNNIVDAVAPYFETMWSVISAGAKIFWEVFTGIAEVGAAIFTGVFNILKAIIVPIVKGIFTPIIVLAQLTWEAIKLAADIISKVFTAAWEFIRTTVIPIVEEIVDWIGTRLSDAITWVGEVAQKVGIWFSEVWEKISNVVSVAMGIIEEVLRPIQPLLDDIGGFFEELATTISEAFSTAVNWIKENDAVLRGLGIVIGIILLPLFVRLAGQAVISVATVIAQFVLMSASAVASAVIHVVQFGIMIARWIALQIQAVISAAIHIVQWVLMAAGAVASVVIHVVQFGIMIARWIALHVQAIASAVIVLAQWLLMSGGVIASALVHVAQFAIIAAGYVGMAAKAVAAAVVVVAQWVIMGTGALTGAAKVALAWFIALGPVGWFLALLVVVAAAVAIFWDDIVAYFSDSWGEIQEEWDMATEFFGGIWDDISADAEEAGDLISGFFKDAWEETKTAWEEAVSFFEGLWDGIFGDNGGADEAVEQMFEQMAAAMEAAVPSFEAKGFEIPGWIADGITANEAEAIAAAGGLAAAIEQGLAAPFEGGVGRRGGNLLGGNFKAGLVETMNAQLGEIMATGAKVPIWMADGITQSEAIAIGAAGGLVAAINAQMPDPALANQGGNAWGAGLRTGIDASLPGVAASAAGIKFNVDNTRPDASLSTQGGNAWGTGIKSGIDASLPGVSGSASRVKSTIDSTKPDVSLSTQGGNAWGGGIGAGINASLPGVSASATRMKSTIDSTRPDVNLSTQGGAAWGGGIRSGIDASLPGVTASAVRTKSNVDASLPKYDNGFASGNALSTGLKQGIDSGSAAAQYAADAMRSAVTSRGPKSADGFNPGVSLANGVASGIYAGMGAAIAAAREMTNRVNATINQTAKIRSPSRVTMWSGKQIAEGLAVGIMGNTRVIEAAARAMAKAATAGLVQPGSFDPYGRNTPVPSRSASPVVLGTVSDARWEELLASGWKGRAGDNQEALYSPANDTKEFVFNTYYPIAERASDTAARKLRTLASLGEL